MKSGVDKFATLAEAILCSSGLMVFSFFVHSEFPVRLFSFGALLISAIIISRNVKSLADFKKITGENILTGNTLFYFGTGVITGILLSFIYRRHLEVSLFPTSIHLFAVTAALIGCMEELVFRGFLQSYVRSINGPFSVLFSTISHTGYKCCLFLSPVLTTNTDIGFLAIWTFGAGLFFGIVRHLSKSLLPSLSAHALFDILVYAEFANAPWWVW